ncbi:RdRP-domain-containing protein [Clavulina sp. PMI_390]|nr:RdRP-domain-containing protein [Clavulina sp. PMI_390]
MAKIKVKTLSFGDQNWDLDIRLNDFNRAPRRSTGPFLRALSIEKRENVKQTSAQSAPAPAASGAANRPAEEHPDDPIFDLVFQTQALPLNRAMSPTLAPRLIHLNIAALRWPNKRPSETGDYLVKILKAGIKINGSSYWFFGHSNSHLRARSCILMSADRPETVHNFVLGMGDFQRIRTAAKFAKRIGLLFSTADTGLDLPTELTEDIPDVMSTDGKVEMSDGCGLISYNFSRALAKKLDIHFQGNIYVPNVFQLRYRGYKGVVATCFALDAKNSKREAGSPKIQAQFRSSMRKVGGITGTLFSVVGYSKPFTFGSLNSEHATLLSSLGISNEVFLKKQAEHFQHIFNATTDIESAILLLSTKSLGDILVQELAIKGLEDPEVQRKFRRLQDHEMSLAINKRGEEKVRILIPQSRRLYGVCDETDSLREGTVFIRVQVPRKGLVTLVNVDVIIVRNPCLHPGDILKRRAVDPGPDYGKFRTECLVFSGKGQRPDASMSSGGDLDGDEFFVCWDKDLIPANVSESYDYPAPKARREPPVTQDRLIEYFARYNTGSLGKVKKYYLEWLRATPRGALGPECQELNALHSDAVDGGAVRIPERLLNVPKNPSDAFILDVLSRKGKEFSEEWQNIHARRLPARGPIPGSAVNNPVTERDLLTLLSSESLALPEYLRFQIMLSYCRRTGADPSQFMPHFHWGELTPNEKYVVQSIAFWDPRYDPGPGLWNSLERSPLLKGYNLKAHHLDGPLSLQRLYTSETDRMLYFFRKLKVAIDYFHRFLIVMKVNSRFTVIIYKCTPIVWGEESLVGNGVRIMALTNAEGRHGSTAVATSFLLTGPRIFQLYSKDLRDTFVFVNMVTVKGVETVQTSIALQKIDSIIQRHVGAVRREDVQEIEIHVVSNRDRVASQQLDLAFNFVGTEEIIRRISRDPKVSVKDSLQRVEWSTFPTHWKEIVLGAKWQFLDGLEEKDVGDIVQFCVSHHAAHRVIPIVDHLLDQRGVEYAPVAVALMSDYAPLLSLLLSNRLHVSPTKPDAELLRQSGFPLLQSLVSIANFAGEATVWIIQDRFLGIIESLHPKDILELMWRASFSVHAPLLSHLIIQVLREMKTGDHSGGVLSHALKLGAAVCIEYSGQLADQLRPSSSNIQGLPRAKSKELLISPKVDEDWQISFDFRKDADLRPRSGDHLRLRDAITDSKVEVDIIDCIVTKSYDGNATLQSYHVPPPQMEDRSWRVYVTGPTATVKAEMDAVAKMTDLTEAPIDLTTIICGGIPDPGGSPLLVLDPPPDDLKLNDRCAPISSSALTIVLTCIQPKECGCCC